MNPVDKFIAKYGRLPTELDTDYLEILNMSRYRILDVPDLQPGKCANCGASKNDGRRYVDFGLNVDWYGIVFLCGECLMDVAKSMGLYNKLQEEVKTLTEKLLAIRKQKANGIKVKDDFLKIFKEVQDYISSLPASDNGGVADPSIVHSAAEATTGEPSELPTNSVESKSDETEHRSIEQDTSGGSSGVPSLKSLFN